MRAAVNPPVRQPSPFLESVRQMIRCKHLNYITEKQYVQYVR